MWTKMLTDVNRCALVYTYAHARTLVLICIYMLIDACIWTEAWFYPYIYIPIWVYKGSAGLYIYHYLYMLIRQYMYRRQRMMTDTVNSDRIQQCNALTDCINGCSQGVGLMTTSTESLNGLYQRLSVLVDARAKIAPQIDTGKYRALKATSEYLSMANSGQIKEKFILEAITSGLIEKVPQVMSPELSALNDEISEVLSEINKIAKGSKATKTGGTRTPRSVDDILDRNAEYVNSLNTEQKLKFEISVAGNGKINVLNTQVSDPITVQRKLVLKGYAATTQDALKMLRAEP